LNINLIDNKIYKQINLSLNMHDKRGQGMSLNTIVILILGVIVLVVLILGFTLGWAKVSPWVSKVNVNDVVTSCEAGCATNSQYDFCSIERELRDENKNNFETTCAVLATVSYFDKYGVESCNIDCRKQCDETSINGLFGQKAPKLIVDVYDVSNLANDLDVDTGEVCIIPFE